MKLLGLSEKVPGWNLYECPRCRDGIHSPYGPEKVVCTCQPKHKYWLALFSEAFGLTSAAAIVRYIRWRAKGSPLDELPPGVPSPALPPPMFTPSEIKELSAHFPDDDPKLFGNRIKAMTEAIGIPACGGCNARAEWLNKAHQWLRASH